MIIFVLAVVGISLTIGYLTPPGTWYQNLVKPAFNPPPWVFGPVWTILYILVAIAGWRIWRMAPNSAAMQLWVVQMVLNWMWSPAFFALQSPWLALVIIVAMLIAILLFMVQARRHDKAAALLFVPYACWVAFATLLNASIAYLN
ncbi:tryptophan-rich sensory protein [Aureimonas fodinaquatilis]|uniref:Tryptophan-rich sensory protein n=2 Tax=Aureimonas fodinaquatilis TaxID=2565783 RepID=A0A5B0E1B9_9HYPH|nr:tryptophan-rich sensory protein [Aureimonas fodinaquatilis]